MASATREHMLVKEAKPFLSFGAVICGAILVGVVAFGVTASSAKSDAPRHTAPGEARAGDEAKPARGWLGVRAAAHPSTDHGHAGTRIARVLPRLAADRAGVRSGDIIVSAGNRAAADRSELLRVLEGLAPGTRIEITLCRDDEHHTRVLELDRLRDVVEASPPRLARGE